MYFAHVLDMCWSFVVDVQLVLFADLSFPEQKVQVYVPPAQATCKAGVDCPVSQSSQKGSGAACCSDSSLVNHDPFGTRRYAVMVSFEGRLFKAPRVRVGCVNSQIW